MLVPEPQPSKNAQNTSDNQGVNKTYFQAKSILWSCTNISYSSFL